MEACARGNILGKHLWELTENEKRSLPCYTVTFAAFDRCLQMKSEQVEGIERAAAEARRRAMEEEEKLKRLTASQVTGDEIKPKKTCKKNCAKCRMRERQTDAVASAVV